MTEMQLPLSNIIFFKLLDICANQIIPIISIILQYKHYIL